MPPSQISTGSNTVWFVVLIGGCIIFAGIPFIIYAMKKDSWNTNDPENQFQPFHWEVAATNNTIEDTTQNNVDSNNTDEGDKNSEVK